MRWKNNEPVNSRERERERAKQEELFEGNRRLEGKGRSLIIGYGSIHRCNATIPKGRGTKEMTMRYKTRRVASEWRGGGLILFARRRGQVKNLPVPSRGIR